MYAHRTFRLRKLQFLLTSETTLWLLLAIALLTGLCGAGEPLRVSPPSERVTDITPYLDQVSSENLWATIDTLSGIWNRRIGTIGNAAAAEYLRQYALDLGYEDAAFDSFWSAYTEQMERNVVFSKAGTTAQDEYVVIGAHYDTGGTPSARAPGADDDASGVAIVLEIARIVLELPLERTTIFALFTGEEHGSAESVTGSRHFVDDAIDQGLDMRLYVNLDCVAYTDGNWRAKVWSYWNLALARAVEQVLRTYTAITPVDYLPRDDDHWFYLAGVPVIYVMEQPLNPRIHSSSDSLRYLSPGYARDMTRGRTSPPFLAWRGSEDTACPFRL